jgi:hypothetical protein
MNPKLQIYPKFQLRKVTYLPLLFQGLGEKGYFPKETQQGTRPRWILEEFYQTFRDTIKWDLLADVWHATCWTTRAVPSKFWRDYVFT